MRGVGLPWKMLGLLILLIGALAPAPAGEAQEPWRPTHVVEVRVVQDQGPITPITGLGHVMFEVTVRCGSPGFQPDLDPRTLMFSLRTDRPWVVVRLSETTEHVELDPRQCVEGEEQRFSVSADIATTKDAPAFELANLYFTAQLDTGERAETSFTVRAGFYDHWQARFDHGIMQAPAGAVVQVPLTVENLGNGAIRVRFRVHETSDPELDVALPGPQVVGSVIAGAETSQLTIPVDVQLPDSAAQNLRLVLIADGTSTEDSSLRLIPTQQTVILQTTGPADESPDVGELPGAGALMAPLLAALLAVAARRRL